MGQPSVDQLKQEVRQALSLAEKDTSGYMLAFIGDDPPAGDHQFLLFFKPELLEPSVRFGSVFDLIGDKLSESGLLIESVQVLTGSYLGAHRIISRHYGVIDAVSRDPAAAISEQGKVVFHSLFGTPVEEAPVVGSLQYLETHGGMSAAELAESWLQRPYEKLAGGTYCQYLEEEKVYLVNGFYPRMLEHYTRPASRIVSLVVSGSVAWEKARDDLLGSTDPAKANPGSIRRVLLERKQSLGVASVTANLNGVHLSAGPVEGLVELMRFTSDFAHSQVGRPHTDFVFGRMLADRFSAVQIEDITANVDVMVNGGQISIFDLTEEKDSAEALQTLQAVSAQLGVRD